MKLQPCKTSKKALKSSFVYRDEDLEKNKQELLKEKLLRLQKKFKKHSRKGTN